MSGGLTTYVGQPPECAICQGQTVIGDGNIIPENNLFEDDDGRKNYEEVKELMNKLESFDELTEDSNCLHEKLEESKPSNHKGEAHMLACPCPKCSPRC